ncbi:MAG: hypothetical protein DBX55_07150 [Verrucomicrobia bacterium]|nr:MAG: hypothetical protein DBX55_07150 [Verrucomicrobiota bacterium]
MFRFNPHAFRALRFTGIERASRRADSADIPIPLMAHSLLQRFRNMPGLPPAQTGPAGAFARPHFLGIVFACETDIKSACGKPVYAGRSKQPVQTPAG